MTNAQEGELEENAFVSLFPRRNLSEGSLGSSSSANTPTFENPSVVLHNKLSNAARFALVDLIASILRLDFWQDSDSSSDNEFCIEALEKVLKFTQLPERTNATVRYHLKGEGATDDIAAFVTLIKDDPYIKQKGASVILACLLGLFIESGSYDCRCRVLLRHICALLALRWDDFEDIEDTLVDTITGQRYNESEEQKLARAKTTKLKKIKRYAMIGAACGVGGVLVGVTGGLAAPLVAAGAGAVIGAGAAAGIATTAGAAVLGSLFGVAGAGLTGYKMQKRVGAIEEFVIEPLSEGRSLHCVLAISGWIEDEGEHIFQQQWRHLWMSREQYILRYESKYLVELGRAIDYLMSFAVSVAVQQTLLETALAGLVAAVAWPVALLSAASVLDNPWNVCVRRAAEVGEQLAEVLLSRAHGKRPITLIGFSMGARVIFHCLMAMTKRSTCFGIVNDVVLLGAPVSASPSQWQQITRVVGGRIINGYCNSDWLLRFIYRTMSVQFTIAGTGPVQCKKERKIVNFNLSHIVKGHLDYSRKLTEVLAAVGVRVTPHRDESVPNFDETGEEPEASTGDFDVNEQKGRLSETVDSEEEARRAFNEMKLGSHELGVDALQDSQLVGNINDTMKAAKENSSQVNMASVLENIGAVAQFDKKPQAAESGKGCMEDVADIEGNEDASREDVKKEGVIIEKKGNERIAEKDEMECEVGKNMISATSEMQEKETQGVLGKPECLEKRRIDESIRDPKRKSSS